MKLLVTGAAGFIGMHVAKRLLEEGHEVIGLDNLNPYYEVQLKKDRLEQLKPFAKFSFFQTDLADDSGIKSLFETSKPERVVHLAAQAGVRYSLNHPEEYLKSNLAGFLNILEGCRHHSVEHLVYASSSSVYGQNTSYPFKVSDNVDHPISFYAASKKANELMAHAYAHLYEIPVTGLRFFTVYGPWGRPDMAYFKFVKKILSGESIDVYNHGKMARDFTYIDDIVEGVLRVTEKIPVCDPAWTGEAPDPASSSAPYRLYNIGSNAPVELMDFIRELESALDKKAQLNFMELQPGDVVNTHADVSRLVQDFGYAPKTSLAEGIAAFVEWYKSYYQLA